MINRRDGSDSDSDTVADAYQLVLVRRRHNMWDAGVQMQSRQTDVARRREAGRTNGNQHVFAYGRFTSPVRDR